MGPNLGKRKIMDSKVSVDRGYASSSLWWSISLDKCWTLSNYGRIDQQTLSLCYASYDQLVWVCGQLLFSIHIVRRDLSNIHSKYLILSQSYLTLNRFSMFYQFGGTAELFSSASKYCNNFTWFDCFRRSNCNVVSSNLACHHWNMS